MRDVEFEKWLDKIGLAKKAIQNRISNCRNVEKKYFDLDEHFYKDKGLSLLALLTYSTEDQRTKIAAKHTIQIDGDIRTGTATLKQSVNLYMKFCEYEDEQGFISTLLKSDIAEITDNKDLSEEQKMVLVKYRIGQSEYRKKLIEYWGGCSVCGCNQTDILIASHIKPWSECNEEEKYDLYNGLLLTPNYDKLFNEYLISFDEFGHILISDIFSDEDLKKLGISRDDKIASNKLTMSHVGYLIEHMHIFLGDKFIY